MCCHAPFLRDARACNYQILFIAVMVGLVVFCWELDVLTRAVPGVFKSARGSQEFFVIASPSPTTNLNVSKIRDAFWCSWSLTDACGVIRSCKNARTCPAHLKCVAWRDVSYWETSPPSVWWCPQTVRANVTERKVFDWGLKWWRIKSQECFWVL